MKRVLLALVLACAACRGCAGPEAPDEYAVSRVSDPYPALGERGGVPDLERAVSVLNAVGKDLGYGEVPGRVLAAHAKEAWAGRLVLFLSHGGTKQLSAAWLDLRTSTLEAAAVSPEVKFRVRQAEARVNDLEHAKTDEETLRQAWLAEIAWTLLLLEKVDPSPAK